MQLYNTRNNAIPSIYHIITSYEQKYYNKVFYYWVLPFKYPTKCSYTWSKTRLYNAWNRNIITTDPYKVI